MYKCVCLKEHSRDNTLALQDHRLQLQDAGPEKVHRGPETINEPLVLGSLTALNQWQANRRKPKAKKKGAGWGGREQVHQEETCSKWNTWIPERSI